MPYISHAMGSTFYTKKGRKRQLVKPLVFLHGGPGGYHDTDSPLFSLSTSRQVFLYDQIGGGKSSPLTQKKMKIETFVRELDILINSWGLSEFHLGGGSWGTTLALEYYLRKRGKKVSSLIFQSPMFSADRWAKDAKKLVSRMSQNDRKVIKLCEEVGATDSSVYKTSMYNYYLKHVLRDDKKLKQVFSKINDAGKRVYGYMWGESEFRPTGTLKNYNRVDELSTINVPTLLLCGQYDEATPEATALFASKIKDSQFKVIQGASHIILKEKPNMMLKELDKFLMAND